MYTKLCDIVSDHSIIIVTTFYSASLTVSTSFQNYLISKHSCNPSIPFGECIIGEYEARFEVHSNSYLQYLISFVIVLLAGSWSDSHGRRRKPLIFIPIIGQILTDCLNFVHHYWYWPPLVEIIFRSVIPGLYVGRNLFWIGVISYISENSSFGSKTFKLGTVIATYTIGSLIGSTVVALLKLGSVFYHYYYTFFFVPIMFNIVNILMGYLFIKDTSDSYNKNIVWMKPKCLYKGFTALFKYKLKSFAVTLGVLIICQSVLVARVGSEYVMIIQFIKHSFKWYDEEYIYFNISKMVAIVFGILFSIVLSNYMKINELSIILSACNFYIIAAVCYFVPCQIWQMLMMMIINLCHGTVVTIITSLTSKMVEIEELGRFNSLQISMNSLLTFGMITVYSTVNNGYYYDKFTHLCLVVLLYIVLTLPIIYVFWILYSKCKNFWDKDFSITQYTSIYIIGI